MPPSRDAYPPRDTAAYRRILASAEALFGTLGFQKVTVVEIAAAAHVSKPLVYRYFESKEHLYEVVIRRLVESWNEDLLAELSFSPVAPAGERSMAEALRRMHRASLDFARQRPLLRGLLARESRLLLASYSDIVERTNATLKVQIEDFLRSGIESGEVRPDLPVEAMADAVTEMHLAYVERIVSGTETPEARRVALDAFECLLFGICSNAGGAAPAPPKRRNRSK